MVKWSYHFWSKNELNMLIQNPNDSPQQGFFDIVEQLDPAHPLLALAEAIPCSELDDDFAPLL